MSIITLRVNRISNRRVTVELTFEVWNTLLATGEPQAVLENIINGWFEEKQREKETYVVTSKNHVKSIDFGTETDREQLVILKEQFAQAQALGRHQKASALRVRITELERNLLAERFEKEGTENDTQ